MIDNKQIDVKGNVSPKELLKRLDNLNWSRWHTKITIILALGWAFDAFEVTIVSAVLSTLKLYFGISKVQATSITIVWLMGSLVGALSFGYFADRFGRKLAFVVTILGYSLMTIVTACSFHFPFFLVFRFLTAVGVGAEYTAVNATISEFIPSKHRGKVNTMVMGFWSLGALIAYGLQYPLLKYLDNNLAWRIGFALGGTAAIFVLFARKSLPESPRWLIIQGRFDEARQIVEEIEISAKQPDNKLSINYDPANDTSQFATHQKYSYFRVVKELVTKYPFRLAFGMVLNSSQAFADYGVSNLLSLGVLGDSGIKDANVALFYLYGVFLTVPGFLLPVFLIDRIGRKILLPCLYILGIIAVACFIPAYYSSNPASSLTGAHCFYQFAYTALWVTVYPAFTEAFPTHVRATGIGFAVAFGRICASVSPTILVAVYTYLGSKGPDDNAKNIVAACGIIFAFFGCGLLMCLAWAIWGVEGKNRSLEDMNADSKAEQIKDVESSFKN
ncbi:MFS general substrate transporter [Neoconidiobolus thromboides FSU 785]|nr:MFS general substrate transporter [Neoconidiobolus thromboides FSU 785]